MAVGVRERAGGLRWLDVQRLLLMVFVGVVFVGLARPGDPAHPLLETDLWWHLANGRYILAHGVPSHEVYSHTAAGHVWVVHEWLADVLFYLLYQLGGLRLLIVLSAAVVAVAAYLVYRLLRHAGLGNNTGVLLGMLLFFAAAPSFGPRPQIINFLLTGVLCLALLRYREHPTTRVWWLLALFVAWANLHSGYLVGVGLLAVFTVAEYLQSASRRLASARQEGVSILAKPDLRRLGALVVLGFLSGLLTPATYRLVLFPLGTLSSSRIQSFIIEWASPDFHTIPGQTLMVCVLILVGGLLASRRPADLTYLLWGAAGLTLALTSQRHVPIFAVAGAPLVGHAAGALLAALGVGPRRPRAASVAAARLNAGILAVLVLLGGAFMTVNLTTPSIDRVVQAIEPVQATEWLLANRPARQLFNFYSFGGWLIWKAYPEYPVFIDGRTEVYGDAVFDDYLKTEFLTDNWQEPLDRYHVNTIMISSGDRLTLLLPTHGWRLAYSDSVARVYVRG
ncbi:MAG: hypothetical protein QOK05_1120 [Chloroflexota bacterium]|nr:hypothetical protein [Chloroflexota bacterium]